MSRMGLSQIINDFFMALGIELPGWTGIAVALGVFVLFFPLFLRNARTTRARKMMKKAGHASGQERDDLELKAIQLVKNNPYGLLALADLAHQMKRYTLAISLLDQLPNKPKLRREARRIRSKMEPRGELTADSAASAVRNLMDEGMNLAAVERLDNALERWPNSRALLNLKQELLSLEQN